MALITLPFNTNPQLTGAMVGDSIYYIDSTNLTGASGESGGTNSSLDNVIFMGIIDSFSNPSTDVFNIVVNNVVNSVTYNYTMPTQNDYVFTTKNNEYNMASVLGYYAQVQFINDSTDAAELFSIGMEVAESSK